MRAKFNARNSFVESITRLRSVTLTVRFNFFGRLASVRGSASSANRSLTAIVNFHDLTSINFTRAEQSIKQYHLYRIQPFLF